MRYTMILCNVKTAIVLSIAEQERMRFSFTIFRFFDLIDNIPKTRRKPQSCK